MGAAGAPGPVNVPPSVLSIAARLGDALLEELREHAARLAGEAGERVASAVGADKAVEYKGHGRGRGSAPTNPVTEVDRTVEAGLRRLVAEAFPSHAFLGEEGEELVDAGGFVWVVDPLDGTTNYTAGFPFFASAVACVVEGVPVVGGVWCSVTPALRPGVYHARVGGPLYLDDRPVAPWAPPPRPLAAAPGGSPGRTRWWDHRVTGCAALEAAFVAAGVFQAATFARLRVWDVAAGVVLSWAAGKGVWVRAGRSWVPFERFEPAPRRRGEPPSLRGWRGTLLMASPEAKERAARASRPAPWLRLPFLR